MKRKAYNRPDIYTVNIDWHNSLVLMSGLPNPNDPWGQAAEQKGFEEEGIFTKPGDGSPFSSSPFTGSPFGTDSRDGISGDSPF